LRGYRIIAGLQDHCGATGSLRGYRIIAGLQDHFGAAIAWGGKGGTAVPPSYIGA